MVHEVSNSTFNIQHSTFNIMIDAYRFFRFSAFGATAVLPLLGAGSVRPRLGLRPALGLLGVAAAFHAFAYVHNDVCDLELDRSQPLRAEYPLVRGDVSPRAALAVALGCVPLAFVIDAWLLGDERRATNGQQPISHPPSSFILHPSSLLASAFALMAAYNRWGKACPFPPATDLLQGAGWTLLIAYGAAAVGRPAGRLTGALMAYELLLILMVNGVHGALRDIGNDRGRGAYTTAIMLGAAETPDGLRVPAGLLAYALALQAGLLALPLWAATENLGSYRASHGTVVAFGVSGTVGLTVALLAEAARGGARPADVGMLHLILLLSAPVALVAPGLGPPLRAVTLLAHTLPLLANGMTYDALRWICGSGIPSSLS
ncbi:UbiA family prenyltransferase [Oscillochloris sp. ZM17-4]|uniref:UbiA family prenyltransferase n=1 Tax=Oscillochloris sp. ZM17-4 TaxID=2866714 RepID=UPI001C732A5F|nr:UbiA family prenyltransferase [Oscillochloris sp. ZM17-4]MBX0328117.1 UbiA family prenyltransferase [Oscillochloris sp. ZM17-4]